MGEKNLIEKALAQKYAVAAALAAVPFMPKDIREVIEGQAQLCCDMATEIEIMRRESSNGKA